MSPIQQTFLRLLQKEKIFSCAWGKRRKDPWCIEGGGEGGGGSPFRCPWPGTALHLGSQQHFGLLVGSCSVQSSSDALGAQRAGAPSPGQGESGLPCPSPPPSSSASLAMQTGNPLPLEKPSPPQAFRSTTVQRGPEWKVPRLPSPIPLPPCPGEPLRSGEPQLFLPHDRFCPERPARAHLPRLPCSSAMQAPTGEPRTPLAWPASTWPGRCLAWEPPRTATMTGGGRRGGGLAHLGTAVPSLAGVGGRGLVTPGWGGVWSDPHRLLSARRLETPSGGGWKGAGGGAWVDRLRWRHLGGKPAFVPRPDAWRSARASGCPRHGLRARSHRLSRAQFPCSGLGKRRKEEGGADVCARGRGAARPPLGSGSGCRKSRRPEGSGGVGPALSLPEQFPRNRPVFLRRGVSSPPPLRRRPLWLLSGANNRCSGGRREAGDGEGRGR